MFGTLPVTSIARLKRILEAIFAAYGLKTACFCSSNVGTLVLKWLATIGLLSAFIPQVQFISDLLIKILHSPVNLIWTELESCRLVCARQQQTNLELRQRS